MGEMKDTRKKMLERIRAMLNTDGRTEACEPRRNIEVEMTDLLDGVFKNYSDAETALTKEHFIKMFDTSPSQFKYNWEFGLVDAGIKAVVGGFKIVQRA